jgi:iron complex outermembrane receptor protein
MIIKIPAQVCYKKTCLSTIAMVPFFLLFLMIPAIVGAQDEEMTDEDTKERARFELEEIVVTATREEDEIRKTPKNVTVITSEDIEQASSNNIVDLLARESNVNLRSFFGHDKGAGVDIRGMGDTYVSNVVVVVDGFRLNSPDLSGPDFSSIPLDQIERIEIVRGAGSVLYGDGAVGGVVNIITKKGAQEPEL